MPPGAGHRLSRVHVLIATHTPRHLAATIAGLSRQTQAPASVVVSSDSDDPDIERVLEEWWPRARDRLPARPPLLLACRPHQGQARLNQVRNNALRAADGAGLLRDDDLALVIDGDTLLFEESVERFGALASAGSDVVIAYRINLDPERTKELTPEALLMHEGSGATTLEGFARSDELLDLGRRQARYQRQLLWRRLGLHRLGLVKAHKPKVLGGHHAVRVGVLRAINAYDERYLGYGYDDDDLSRRLLALRPTARVTIAVDECMALHLWHPSRAPQRPTDAPGYATFRQGGPVACVRGWASPADQPGVTVTAIG